MAKICAIAFVTSMLMRWKRFRTRNVEEDDAVPPEQKASGEEAREEAVNISLSPNSSEYEGDCSSLLEAPGTDSSLFEVSGPSMNIEDIILRAQREMSSNGKAGQLWDFLRAIPRDSSDDEVSEISSLFLPVSENQMEESIPPLSSNAGIPEQVAREEYEQQPFVVAHVGEEEEEDDDDDESSFERFFFGDQTFECAGRLRPTSPTLHYSLGGSYISSEPSYCCVGNIQPTSPTLDFLGGSYLDVIAPRAIEVPRRRRRSAPIRASTPVPENMRRVRKLARANMRQFCGF